MTSNWSVLVYIELVNIDHINSNFRVLFQCFRAQHTKVDYAKRKCLKGHKYITCTFDHWYFTSGPSFECSFNINVGVQIELISSTSVS